MWSSVSCFKPPALARRQRLSAADREQYVFLPNHSFALLRQSRINNWQWPGKHVGHANGLVSGSWLYAPHTTVSRPADSLAYDSISPESSSIRHHAEHSTTNKSTCVGSTVCPPNSHEAVADRAGRREGQRIRGQHSGSSKNVSRDTEEPCADSHESQQERYGWYEFKCSKRRARTHPGCNDQGDRDKELRRAMSQGFPTRCRAKLETGCEKSVGERW